MEGCPLSRPLRCVSPHAREAVLLSLSSYYWATDVTLLAGEGRCRGYYSARLWGREKKSYQPQVHSPTKCDYAVTNSDTFITQSETTNAHFSVTKHCYLVPEHQWQRCHLLLSHKRRNRCGLESAIQLKRMHRTFLRTARFKSYRIGLWRHHN